jgi:uncharacterized protein YbaR (Trm112 family)
VRLDPKLLSILVCPADRGPLLFVDDPLGNPVLYNSRLRRAYPISDGIPVLLVEAGLEVSPAEHEQLTGLPPH